MSDNKTLRHGIYWWFVRILPLFMLYLFVKFAFLSGYFNIFGSTEIQIIAHNFFVKILVSVCIVITFVAFKKYFISSMRELFGTSIKRNLRSDRRGEDVINALSGALTYSVLFVILLLLMNIWLQSSIGFINEIFKTSTIMIISFFLGLFTSGLLGNVIAYWILRRVKEFRRGHRVKIDNVYGDIMDVGFFFTHVRNLDNEILSIPNLMIITKGIKNYSTYSDIAVHFDLSVPHGVDIEKVKVVILDAAKKTDGIIATGAKKPKVLFKGTGDWSIICEVRGYTNRNRELVEVKSNLVENVLKELRKHKIPTGRDINLYKGK